MVFNQKGSGQDRQIVNGQDKPTQKSNKSNKSNNQNNDQISRKNQYQIITSNYFQINIKESISNNYQIIIIIFK